MMTLIGDLLAKVNALLNLTSFAFLVLGFVYVKRRELEKHERFMRLAFWTSGLFLVSYLTRFALTGSHKFPGEGLLRTVYLVILFSHMVLATVIVPLVLRTIFLGSKKRFGDHRRIAKVTLPMWLYVSVTGVVVYAMLYHVVHWV